MTIPAPSPQEYTELIEDPDKQSAIIKLRNVITQNLPPGFEEGMSYGMIGYYVPHELYPAGYHCDPKLPLPFVNIAAQKNFVAIYHMGIYANPELLNWFVSEHQKHSDRKLDLGKSCIRYKKPELIPYELVGTLMTKLTPEDWISLYENAFHKTKS